MKNANKKVNGNSRGSRNPFEEINPLEELARGKEWENIFKLINELRKEWNKPELSKEERERIKKLFEEYSLSGKNILEFSSSLEGKDRVLWEEFLAVVKAYPYNLDKNI